MPEQNSENKLPSLLEQITNLATTGRDVVLGWLKNGQVKASSQMQKDRIEVCLTCDKLTDDFRCSQCGCFIRKKSGLITQDCPLRKWPQKEY